MLFDSNSIELPSDLAGSVCLFSNQKDEKHFTEWIIHHLNIGFDYIFVVDHVSVIPLRTMISDSLLNKVFVFEIKPEEKFGNHFKYECLDSSFKFAKQCCMKWMLYLDGDEFLAINNKKYSTIKEYLNDAPVDTSQIRIPWLMYGSNGYDNHPEGQLIMETYLKSASALDHRPKSFCRPEMCNGHRGPHCWNIHRGKSLLSNFKVDNSATQSLLKKEDIPGLEDCNVFIAHYYYQSYEEHLRRKILRVRDDIQNQKRSHIDKKNFHNLDNDMLNTFMKDNYVPLIKK